MRVNLRRSARSILAATTVLATVLAAAACSDDEPDRTLGKQPGGFWGPTGSATSTITGPPETTDTQESAEESVTVRTDPRDSGAAFDPCTVFTFEDLPDSVRPTQQDVPFKPVDAGPDVGYQAACSLVYTADAVEAGAEPNEKQFLAVFVAVGVEPTMSADPSRHQQADPANWGGRSGTRKTTNDDGIANCMGFVPVGTDGGVGSVSVINTLLPSVAPCTLVDILMTDLVHKVP